MAANKQQGQWFGVFMIGLTVACSGLAWISGGLGKAALALGLILLAASAVKFMALKKLEGRIALNAQPAAMKMVGVVVTLVGWLIVLFGLHITKGVGGRMVIALVGLAIALAGPLMILPAACNKNAIWKA
jgi:galactokinase